MNPKMKSAIEKITLNDATFSNEVIEPTYVNFFYGKNGAGKSTIARTFKANDERLQWQAGKASTDYDVLVYDTDFINANLRNYGNLAGVFTVNETNIAIQEQVDTLNAERKKMGEEYNGHKAAIDQKTADKNTALSTFQSDCWSKSAEARTLFDEAIKGKKKAALFAQEILAITPVAHDVEDLKTLYGTVFSGDAQQYNMLSKAGKVTYASLPGYQMEFLMERGEVSRKDGIAVIKDAFICFSGGYTFSGKKGEPYKTDSVNNFAIRTLIQAVGRICRTGLKNPDIYIYVDNTILTDYDLSVVEQRMLNPEFAELVKVGKTYYNGQANENLDIAVMENRAGTLALKAMQIINELKRNWTDDSIDYWKALRELCLMRPTLSRKNVEQNSQYQLVYMCAPGEITAYSYEQEGDYNKNINIKFDGSLPQKMSEDEVHLKEIMQIPGVKALFEKHGYATSFVPSEFILTPPMFNNIYKGALGEVLCLIILRWVMCLRM